MKTNIHYIAIAILAALIITAAPQLASRAYAIDACELEYSNDGDDSDDPCVVINNTSMLSVDQDSCTFKRILERLSENHNLCKIEVGRATGVNTVFFQPAGFPVYKDYFNELDEKRLYNRIKEGSTKTVIDEPIDIELGRDTNVEKSYNPWTSYDGKQGVLISGAVPVFPAECMGSHCKEPANSDGYNGGYDTWIRELLHGTISDDFTKVTEDKKVAIIDPTTLIEYRDYKYKARIEVDLDDPDRAAITLRGNGIVIFQDIHFVVKSGILLSVEEGVEVYFDRCKIQDARLTPPHLNVPLMVSDHATQISFEKSHVHRPYDRAWHGPTTALLKHSSLIFAKKEHDYNRLNDYSGDGLIVTWRPDETAPQPYMVSGRDDVLHCVQTQAGSCTLSEDPGLLFYMHKLEEIEQLCEQVQDEYGRWVYSCETTLDLTDYDPEFDLYFDIFGRPVEIKYPDCPDGKPMNIYGGEREKCPMDGGYFDVGREQVICDPGYSRDYDESGRMICVLAIECPRGTHYDADSNYPVKSCALDDGNEWSADGRSAYPECPGDVVPDGRGEPKELADGSFSHCVCADGGSVEWRHGYGICRGGDGGDKKDGSYTIAHIPQLRVALKEPVKLDIPRYAVDLGKVKSDGEDDACPDGSQPVFGVCEQPDTDFAASGDTSGIETGVSGCSLASSSASLNLTPILLLIGAMIGTALNRKK